MRLAGWGRTEMVTTATHQNLVRAQLEDAVERLLAILDALDGEPDLEDGMDAEPSLGVPENHHASQIGWMRGSNTECEAA